MKTITTILLSLTILLVLPLSVMAQTISLSLSPPLIETMVKPGKSLLVAYTLENNADPAIMRAYVRSFEPKGNTGSIRIKDELEGPVHFSLDNSDIELDKPFFMKPNGSQQLLLRIRVPEGAPEGDYYYTLLASSEPPSMAISSSASGARATIGANILITVTQSGYTKVNAKIALFDVLSHFSLPFIGKIHLFDSSDKVPVSLVLQNNGANFLKPEGSIEMRGNFGEKATYDLLPQNVLAESQRLLTATPSADLDCEATKNSLCKAPASLILSGFFIGKYNLSTTINFGDGTPNIYASTSFFALPFKFLFGLIVAIGIGVLVIIKIKNREN